MAMGAYRGHRNEVHGGAAEVPAASSPGDPARVRRDAADTAGGKPPEDRGPGSRIPFRKVVLVMVGVAVVVVAFVSSYSIALGKPGARHLPVAVTAPPAVLGKLDASPLLKVDPVPDLARARAMVEDRTVYGALVLPRRGAATLLVANGGGHAVETILVQLGQQVARADRTTLRTVDVAPTSPDDPNGTVEFYCIAFLMLGSAIGATVLRRVMGAVHGVRGPRGAAARLGLVAVYAAWLSVVVTFFADVVLGDLVGHFGVLFLTLWLYSAAACLAVTGLSALVGPGGIVLILVLICLGNPSSGGPVPRPLLNGFYSGLNPVMPQGAALSALRAVQYFGGWGIGEGLMSLAIWAAAGLILLGAAALGSPKAGKRSAAG
jgi:hypothetical protein